MRFSMIPPLKRHDRSGSTEVGAHSDMNKTINYLHVILEEVAVMHGR